MKKRNKERKQSPFGKTCKSNIQDCEEGLG